MNQLYLLLVIAPAIVIFILMLAHSRASIRRRLKSLSVHVPKGVTMDGASIQDVLVKWDIPLTSNKAVADLIIEYVTQQGRAESLGIWSPTGRLLINVDFCDRRNYRITKITGLLYKAMVTAELIPWQTCHRISDIPFSLFANGTRCIIVDFDNTLAKRDKPITDNGILGWFIKLHEELPEILIVIVSNLVVKSARRLNRLKAAAEKIGAVYVAAYGRQVKPNAWPYLQSLEIARCEKSEVFVIGDQLFTDIKGANRCGIKTILVDPLGKDAWYTAWKRLPERRIRQRLKF